MLNRNDTCAAINEAARKVHNGGLENGSFIMRNGTELNYLYTTLMKLFCKEYASDFQLCQDAFSISLIKALKGYDPDEDFLPFFKTVFERQKSIVYRQINKKVYENAFNIDAPVSYEDGNENSSEVRDPRQTIDKKLDNRAILEDKLQIAATKVHIDRRKYIGRKTICYSAMFFADDISLVALSEAGEWTDEMISRNVQRFDEATDMDFLNSFLTDCCDSVTDIVKSYYKMLSEITGDSNDADTCCRPDIYNIDDTDIVSKAHLNDRVFTAFISKAYGKDITTNAVINHRNEYDELKGKKKYKRTGKK